MYSKLKLRFFLELKLLFQKYDDPATIRTQHLKIALITSFCGKGVSIVAQLVAVPIAIASLGVERFGVYAVLTALLNWLNMATVGVSPGLTVQIVSANANKDRVRETEVFTTAFLFSVVLSTGLFILLHSIIYIVGIKNLFGTKLLNHSVELQHGLFVLSIFMMANIILSVVEATQAGYQNQYLNNILLSIGSVTTIIFILLVVRNWPTIPNMILAVFGAPLIARIMNMAQLFKNHKHLIPKFKNFKYQVLKTLLSTGCAFLLTQLGSFLYQNFTIYLVGRQLGATSAAKMSIMMLVLGLSGSLLIMFTQPLWPAIQDAVTRNDFNWIKKTYTRVQYNFIPYIAVIAVIIGFYGNSITSLWLQSASSIDSTTQALWGLYFLLVAWEHINYSFVIGLGKFWLASTCFLSGAIVMVVTSLYLIGIYGLTGVFAAMCIGPLLLTGWLFPYAIKRIFKENEYISFTHETVRKIT